MRIQWKAVLLASAASCTSLAGQAQSRRAPVSTTCAAPSPGSRIDINHASAEELMKIPGMTPTWAARIVRFRPYRSKQNLVDQGVLTTQVYDRIKDCIVAHRDKQ